MGIRKAIGSAFLAANGWKIEGGRPSVKSYVAIAAPHTSNWDLVYMLAISWALDMSPSWLGKHSLFKGAKGALLRKLGGVPVDRRAKHGVVDQAVSVFAERDDLVLAVPPEGTRAHADHWKSGFYQIALGAKVPVALGYLDYGRKIGGIGGPVTLTGDLATDMDAIRDFYRDIQALYPKNYGPIRLRGEDSDEKQPQGRPSEPS